MVSFKHLFQFFKEEWIRFKNFINAEQLLEQFLDRLI